MTSRPVEVIIVVVVVVVVVAVVVVAVVVIILSTIPPITWNDKPRRCGGKKGLVRRGEGICVCIKKPPPPSISPSMSEH